MANYVEKIIYGMDKIHIAVLNEETGQYETPVAVLGAKSCEVSYEVSEKNISADNKVIWNSKQIATGSGTLSVLGLTAEEKRMLFGGDEQVGFALRSNQKQPSVAILFAQQLADGTEQYTVIYNCKFSPAGINAVTLEEGEVEEQVADMEFNSIQAPNDTIFYFTVNTGEKNGAEEIVAQWFTEVQFPQA